MKSFTVGQLYFLYRFLDDGCVVPTIESLFFLGENIFPGEEGPDRWFFQDAASYVRGGPFSTERPSGLARESSKRPEGQLWEFTEDQVQDLLSATELGAKLTSLGAD